MSGSQSHPAILRTLAGHATITCTENRVFDISNIAIELPDKAWELLRLADAEKDLDDIRAVCARSISID